MKPLHLRSDNQQGYSLVEVVYALSIAVLVLGMAMYFVVQGTRSSLRAAASSENDLLQWSISSRLQVDSKTADGLVIYPDANSANIALTKRCSNNAETGARSRGNLMVLTRSSTENGSRETFYDKLTGYLFDPSAKTLSKFEYTVTGDARKQSLETIVKSCLGSVDYKVIAKDVETIDPEGPFICRDLADRNVNAAAAAFKLTRGNAKMLTKDSLIIDIAFRIRS